jgi:hypothetical protein
MANSSQSYSNHAQYTPLYHFFTSPLALVFLVWSLTRFFKNPGYDTTYFLIGALAMFGVVSVSRLSPLKAQDRLIRLEEQLRYQRLLPAALAEQAAATFSPRHYIALRFAGDAELAGLVQKVIANPGLKGKEIKQQITNWRADTVRV